MKEEFDSEAEAKQAEEKRIWKVFLKCRLPLARCFGSKSGYRENNPKSWSIPNAAVFCRTKGRIWGGDLDLAIDKPKIEEAARRLRSRLWILHEMDGLFAEEKKKPWALVRRDAVWCTGGPMPVPGLRTIARRADVRPGDLAFLLDVPKAKLFGKFDSAEALKLRKETEVLDVLQRVLMPKTWRGTWGRWVRTPSPLFGGRKPLKFCHPNRFPLAASLLSLHSIARRSKRLAERAHKRRRRGP